jgi:FeS assembly SUF system protein
MEAAMNDRLRKHLSVINPNDKVEQLRQAFDGAARPTEKEPCVEIGADPEKAVLKEKVVDAIRTVYDPEIPVNIYDLGLIYAIDIDAESRVKIRMTLTAPGCPVAGDIVANVERVVENVAEVKSADVELVFEPQWTKERMSEAALLELGLL